MEVGDLALLLNNEVATVLAALRGWAAASTRYTDDEMPESLVEDFQQLRRKIFTWKSLGDVEPLHLLHPFFEVIRTPETSGPVTGAALGSLRRLIQAGFLAAFPAGVGEAVAALADAVTSCKFEATVPGSDECVLFRILEVLAALVASPWGAALPHDTLLNALQAAYRIGHYQTEKGRATSEVLAHASRDTLAVMVGAVFSRLGSLPADLGSQLSSPFAAAAHAAAGGHHLVVEDEVELQGAGAGNAESDAALTAGGNRTEAGDAGSAPAEAVEPAQHSIVSLLPPPSAGGAVAPVTNPVPTDAGSMPTISTTPRGASQDGGASPSTAGRRPGVVGYGPDCVREILAFGLRLLLVVLDAAGPALTQHADLAALLAADLPRAMFEAGADAPPTRLAALCCATLALHARLGARAIVQVEALVRLLLLPLAEGRGGAGPERQRVALEGLLDLCRQPGFAAELYLAADCRVERADLLQDICALLSKTAQPGGGGGGEAWAGGDSAQTLALEGLLALLASLDDVAEGGGASDIDPGVPRLLDSPGHYVDRLKSLLASAAEHYNRDPKKGLQYAQAARLLPPTLDPATLARFLRCCPGLNEAAVGEALGERDDFSAGVRTAYLQTFDLAGLDFDVALRLFLDAFRLPGEGQRIDRIMEAFGGAYHAACPGSGLASPDAAYVLAFSVIMLNTDLHKQRTDRQPRMTLEGFRRMNDATNDGEPMPAALLQHLFSFLLADSLLELLQALAWGGGDLAALVASGEPTDSAELCLELLITVALRNRDRVTLIWPLVHEVLAAATSASQESNALVERAVLGLLRVCERLLPYKEETAEMLLKSLTLVLAALLRSSARYIRSEADWKTVCALVRLTSLRPEAAPAAFEALSVAVHDPRALSTRSFPPLLETCLHFVERYRAPSPDLALRFLEMVEALLVWLRVLLASPPSVHDAGAWAGALGTLVLLAVVEILAAGPGFYALWSDSLSVLAECMSVPDEGVRDSVPENVKNMLLVLATNGVLVPGWRDAKGASLWDLTWGKAHAVSSGLNPGLLVAAGPAAAAAGSPQLAQEGATGTPEVVSPPTPGKPLASGGDATTPAAPDAVPPPSGVAETTGADPPQTSPGSDREEGSVEEADGEQASSGCKQS
ncbi:ARF guanine-nucleotide exchange factor GNOM [Auxenochlorella protothecoides]|uniref:ARF guanine-nucleotide exchange factor GNOM n=1 Tax=Auxenochlorella protothecoides TaxID=3075 RepID=A0A087SE06_AUXPR|nr:ARF guanine-nucleotide exchange factor GNOM [Auxenochlorella protothecoides]KFM23960.1 ARF guanine-nucleotide exchange factor GNOM [Auxenochlorella protothecoides]